MIVTLKWRDNIINHHKYINNWNSYTPLSSSPLMTTTPTASSTAFPFESDKVTFSLSPKQKEKNKA